MVTTSRIGFVKSKFCVKNENDDGSWIRASFFFGEDRSASILIFQIEWIKSNCSTDL